MLQVQILITMLDGLFTVIANLLSIHFKQSILMTYLIYFQWILICHIKIKAFMVSCYDQFQWHRGRLANTLAHTTIFWLNLEHPPDSGLLDLSLRHSCFRAYLYTNMYVMFNCDRQLVLWIYMMFQCKNAVELQHTPCSWLMEAHMLNEAMFWCWISEALPLREGLWDSGD